MSTAGEDGPCSAWREQVGGDELGVGRVVGDHRDLRRPGEQVDADAAEQLALGLGDERVARRRRSCRRAPMPSIPKAIAASACTPPSAKMRSAPEVAIA